MITSRAKYALKALAQLASCEPGEHCLIDAIARTEQMPRDFLAQILHDLKMRGLVRSRKGRGGGYRLARPADRITVSEVLRATDGPLAPVSCVSQTAYAPCRDCADERTCPIRMVMGRVRDAMAAILDRTTVADLARESVGRETAINYEI